MVRSLWYVDFASKDTVSVTCESNLAERDNKVNYNYKNINS
jgi:hypothetical protein